MNIILPHGIVALIDDEDAHFLDGLNWSAKWDTHTKTYYVRANPYQDGKRVHIALHRRLMGLSAGDVRKVDHRNSDGLDNRRENLRISTNQQNCYNQRLKPNVSGFKGVTWHAPTRQWRARIRGSNKRIHLGLFRTAKDAHAAYCVAAKQYHGEFARLT